MQWKTLIPEQTDPWFYAFLTILLALGLMRQSEGARLSLFIRSVVNTSLLTQQVRQERAYNRIVIPIFLVALLVISLFIIQVAEHFNLFSNESFWVSLGVVFGALLLLTIGRAMVYLALAMLFGFTPQIRLINLQWLQLNFILALILLPLSITLTFGPESFEAGLIWTGLILIGLTYILRSLRLFSTAHELQASLVYNVLYLCALEILPPILVVVSILRQGEG